MIVESAVERFRFTCLRCDTWWDDDYEVRAYTDTEGIELAYYRHGGVPCEVPLSADTPCPACRCGSTYVSRLEHRAWHVAVAVH